MPPLKVGVVIDGTDHFFRAVELELSKRHVVDRFIPRLIYMPMVGRRINEWLLNQQLGHFLSNHDVVFFEWAASLLVRATNLPRRGRIVTRLHSVELETAADQVNWALVDSVIVLSRSIRDRLLTVAAPASPDVRIVANGVNLELFRLRPIGHGWRLGTVCSIIPIKRVYDLVLCLSELRRSGYPFTLHVAGAFSPTERRYAWAVQHLIQRLSLGDSVQLYGRVDSVAGWLQSIDIFISNSYWEGQQVALLEAMAAGCYCLSHCWAGVEEVLPPENIFTTDVDLREKILAYAALSEEEKRQEQMKMRTIAEERFDERRMVQKIIEIIEEVARR